MHTIEIDVEQLYSDATEFIPSVARNLNVIMKEGFNLDQEDLKFLRSRKLTVVERLINIIDCDQQTGNALKKALFDRIRGNDDFDTIRNLKRERDWELSSHMKISFFLLISMIVTASTLITKSLANFPNLSQMMRMAPIHH